MISRLLISLLSVSIWVCGGTGIPDCTGHTLGYYCVSKTKFYWCYGNAAPSAKYCTDGLECKCGFTTDNPCVWSSSTLSCPGIGSTFPEENDTYDDQFSSSSSPGGGNIGITINGQFAALPTEHLPLVIHFDKKNWRSQLKDLMAKSFYNDSNQYRYLRIISFIRLSFSPSPLISTRSFPLFTEQNPTHTNAASTLPPSTTATPPSSG